MGLKWGGGSFSFSFLVSLVDRRSTKGGREGGWRFGEERGKGGRLNTIEGGDVLSFFSGSGV